MCAGAKHTKNAGGDNKSKEKKMNLDQRKKPTKNGSNDSDRNKMAPRTHAKISEPLTKKEKTTRRKQIAQEQESQKVTASSKASSNLDDPAQREPDLRMTRTRVGSPVHVSRSGATPV